ncbi:MAG: type III pantothenate kinase [Candidatus Omnitrophica bacterium]|nr:type III pantothenate kinase [Candidatus Omnitrophota bacterium]
MILAVDIGNTSISLALLNGRQIKAIDNLNSRLKKNELKTVFRKVLSRISKDKIHLKEAIICSVVPDKTDIVVQLVKKELDIPVHVIGKDWDVPVKNKYYNPKQVGQDRLVVAYAAKMLYGQPAIVIDFGTAITFDVLSSKGHYEGGMIVPGIRLSMESLYSKTALLPRIETVKSPKNVIGKNTEESILSGIFYGYGEMCNGLIHKLSSQMKQKPKVIITGGYTQVMKRFITVKITKIDRLLVFKGMALLSRHYHSF